MTIKRSVLGLISLASIVGTSACGAGSNDQSGGADEAEAEEIGVSKEALSGGHQGFAWVNLSNGNVNTSYSYSTAGGTISVSSAATGAYTVRFPGLGGSGGNAQVVAYGSGSARCKVASWGTSGADEVVGVRCHTAAGAAVNSAFVVHYGRKTSNNGVGAYLWADQASAASYYPSASYSWNSTGGTNSITRTATGAYTVRLPGLAATGGTVEVTAYGTSSQHCKVASWVASGADQLVYVRCFNTTGGAADTQYALNYQGPANVSVFDEGAFAWADNATSASYTPNTNYSYDSGNINGWPGCGGWLGTTTGGKTSTGTYFMRHTNLDPMNSAAIVTAYGTDSKYCKVTGWSANGTGVQINTQCYTSGGSLSDTQYVGTYATKWVRGPC
jgi:hypothetical protein